MSVVTRWSMIALLVSCSAIAYAGPEPKDETVSLDEQPFQNEMTRIAAVRLHLRDGDFRIVGGDSDQISIRAEGKNAPLARKMKVQIRRSGDSLDLTFLNVPKNELQVTIAIPRETSLYARMRAGDLSVDGITGIRMWNSRLGIYPFRCRMLMNMVRSICR